MVLDEAALVDGFSGASYYHWLVETLPKLLVLSETLAKRGEPRPLPLLLPAGGKFIEKTLHLLGRDAFRPFGTLHKRDLGLVARVTKRAVAVAYPESRAELRDDGTPVSANFGGVGVAGRGDKKRGGATRVAAARRRGSPSF